MIDQLKEKSYLTEDMKDTDIDLLERHNELYSIAS